MPDYNFSQMAIHQRYNEMGKLEVLNIMFVTNQAGVTIHLHFYILLFRHVRAKEHNKQRAWYQEDAFKYWVSQHS